MDGSTLKKYRDVAEAIRDRTDSVPVMCLHRDTLVRQAADFVEGFDGTVLYAVKANPHPCVIEAIAAGGVTHFDAASIGEIELLHHLLADCDISFNNPVKPESAIARAFEEFGVRDFVVDHPDELEKVLRVAGPTQPDLTIQVRLGRPSPDSVVDLNSKFGASRDQALDLLSAIDAAGARPAVSFHVGWQAQRPGAFREMLAEAVLVSEAAAIAPAYINVGGGFPSVVMPKDSDLADYWKECSGSSIPLRAEPGSALVSSGAVIAAQVLLRKDQAVYLSDGIYGGLNEHRHYPSAPVVRVWQANGEERKGSAVAVTVFGPTCDSLDVLPNLHSIPETTEAGDWVVFANSGSYSNALQTRFNHLGSLEIVEVLEG